MTGDKAGGYLRLPDLSIAIFQTDSRELTLGCLRSVVHHGAGSTRLVASEMFARLYASKVRFLRRNRGAGSARGFKVALAVAAAARLIAAPLALLLRPRDASLRSLTADYSQLLARLPGL